MTTIAYKSNIIAYDTRCTQDCTIISDSWNKQVIRNGVIFFLSGQTDYEQFIKAYFGEEVKSKPDNNAIVYDNGKLYKCGIDRDNIFWRHPIKEPTAIGSGTDHALTAMDMGADAKTAVKMAMKRDIGTGGRIRTFKL